MRMKLFLLAVIAVVVVASDRAHRIADRKRDKELKTHHCGFYVDCTMNYTAQWINESVALDDAAADAAATSQQLLHDTSRAACERNLANRTGPSNDESILHDGGWCLDETPNVTMRPRDTGELGGGWYPLPNGQSYGLPMHHVRPDGPILHHLIR